MAMAGGGVAMPWQWRFPDLGVRHCHAMAMAWGEVAWHMHVFTLIQVVVLGCVHGLTRLKQIGVLEGRPNGEGEPSRAFVTGWQPLVNSWSGRPPCCCFATAAQWLAVATTSANATYPKHRMA